MCGRYVIEDFQELSERLTNLRIQVGVLDSFRPSWNVAPKQVLPVVFTDDGTPELTTMQWGLYPAWTKPGEKPKIAPINARSETVAEKPMFRGLIKKNRCIIPANGFYEWRKEGSSKQSYFIRPTDGQLFLFAGLWSTATSADGELFQTYTILTTNASDKMVYLHDRQPVSLTNDDADMWLDADIDEAGPLGHLFAPPPDEAIDYYPVTKAVGSPKNNSPENIELVQ